MAYPKSQVPDHRKKWDVAEFESKAQDRLEEEREKLKEAEDREKGIKRPRKEKIRRELLKPRDFTVDLESKVGKTVVINKTTPGSESGGYYCDICDCVVKDSINFLDHINGKKHQKNMGMSMKVKKSTVDDVKARFQKKKEEKEQKKKEYDFQERMSELQEEEAKMAEYRRQKKLDLKKRKRGEVDEEEEESSSAMDPQFAAMMGFTGFSTSKK